MNPSGERMQVLLPRPLKRKASTEPASTGLEFASPPKPPRRRAAIACQHCRQRKVRCNVTEQGAPCTNCRLDEVKCLVPESKRKKKYHILDEDDTADHTTAGHATAERPTAERPTAERPIAEHATAEHATAEHATAERPTAERPPVDHDGTALPLSRPGHPSSSAMAMSSNAALSPVPIAARPDPLVFSALVPLPDDVKSSLNAGLSLHLLSSLPDENPIFYAVPRLASADNAGPDASLHDARDGLNLLTSPFGPGSAFDATTAPASSAAPSSSTTASSSAAPHLCSPMEPARSMVPLGGGSGPLLPGLDEAPTFGTGALDMGLEFENAAEQYNFQLPAPEQALADCFDEWREGENNGEGLGPGSGL